MVQFYIDVKEKVNGEWVPYQAKDMQVNIFVRWEFSKKTVKLKYTNKDARYN